MALLVVDVVDVVFVVREGRHFERSDCSGPGGVCVVANERWRHERSARLENHRQRPKHQSARHGHQHRVEYGSRDQTLLASWRP